MDKKIKRCNTDTSYTPKVTIATVSNTSIAVCETKLSNHYNWFWDQTGAWLHGRTCHVNS